MSRSVEIYRGTFPTALFAQRLNLCFQLRIPIGAQPDRFGWCDVPHKTKISFFKTVSRFTVPNLASRLRDQKRITACLSQ